MSQFMEFIWAICTAGSLSLFSILFYPIDQLSLFKFILVIFSRTLGIIIFGYLIYYISSFILKIFKVKTSENINTFIITTSMVIVMIIYIVIREMEKNYLFF